MVSVLARNIANRRQHQTLCELFDKADVTKDGTISFAEYQAMCDEYGVKLQPEDRVAIKAIADEDGEIHKNDFVMHLKQSSMLREFEVANEDSEIHWKKKADLAFRIFDVNRDGFVNKKEFQWMTTNTILSQKKIDTMFKRCDLDGDGKLNYDEFIRLIFRHREREEKQKQAELAKARAEAKRRAKEMKDTKKKKKVKGKKKCE